MDEVFLRDLDGTGSMHPCAQGDAGAITFVPLQFWPTSWRLSRAERLVSDAARRFKDPNLSEALMLLSQLLKEIELPIEEAGPK